MRSAVGTAAFKSNYYSWLLQLIASRWYWMMWWCVLCFRCWLCSCIPFCVDDCKDIVHTCPSCGFVLGRHRRL